MAACNGHQKTPTALHHDTSLTPTVPYQSQPMPVSRTPAPSTMLPAVAAQHGPPPPAPISHPISTSQPTPPTPVPRHNHKSTSDTGFRTFNTSTPRTHTHHSHPYCTIFTNLTQRIQMILFQPVLMTMRLKTICLALPSMQNTRPHLRLCNMLKSCKSLPSENTSGAVT